MNPYEAPQNVDEESKPRVATASIPHYYAILCSWCVMYFMISISILIFSKYGIAQSDWLLLILFSTAITLGLSYFIIRSNLNLLPVMSFGCAGMMLYLILYFNYIAGIMGNRPLPTLHQGIIYLADCFDFTNNASNPWRGSIAANGLSWQGAIFVTVLYQFCIFAAIFAGLVLDWCCVGIQAWGGILGLFD